MCVTCCLQLGWTTTVTGHAAQLARTFQHSCTAATVTVVAAGAVARRSHRKCARVLCGGKTRASNFAQPPTTVGLTSSAPCLPCCGTRHMPCCRLYQCGGCHCSAVSHWGVAHRYLSTPPPPWGGGLGEWFRWKCGFWVTPPRPAMVMNPAMLPPPLPCPSNGK